MLTSCLKNGKSDSLLCKDRNEITTQLDARSISCSNGRSVTFADFFGKRLEFVKTITPNSSFEDLSCFSTGSNDNYLNQNIDLNNNNNSNCCKNWKDQTDQGFILRRKNPTTKERKNGSIKFLSYYLPQPLFRRDFDQRFKTNNVCLENVFVSSGSSNVLIGVIRVNNIAYIKHIFVRYTLNRWKDHSDKRAEFTYQCCDGKADKFIFQLLISPKIYGHEILDGIVEFAICYRVNNLEFWDNNYGHNYRAEYFKKL